MFLGQIDEEDSALMSLQQKASALIKLNNSTAGSPPAATTSGNPTPTSDQLQKTEESSTKTDENCSKDDQKLSTDSKCNEPSVSCEGVEKSDEKLNVDKDASESVPKAGEPEKSSTIKLDDSAVAKTESIESKNTDISNIAVDTGHVESGEKSAAKVDLKSTEKNEDLAEDTKQVVNGEPVIDHTGDASLAPAPNAEAKVLGSETVKATDVERPDGGDAKIEASAAKIDQPEVTIKVEEGADGSAEIKKEPDPGKKNNILFR